MPPVGKANVLSVAEIRWCLREDIRIETKRSYVKTNWGVDFLNKMVLNYNQRCGSYQYRRESLERADREVEQMRPQIVAEAMGQSTTTKNLSRSAQSQSSWSNTIPLKPSNSSQGAGRTALTYEVQRQLKQLGYNPGQVDGIYGRKTKAAIEEFQINEGISSDGKVTEDLRYRLERARGVTTPKRHL